MAEAGLDWGDVQGTILRGYRVDLARHLVLKVGDAAAARSLLGALVGGDPALPQITTAARWESKPDSFLNVGITYEGLRALGLPADSLASFPKAFRRGATDPQTATLVGDVGGSAPEHWIGGLSTGADVHLILSVWVPKDRAALEDVSGRLRAAFADAGAATELSCHDADALPGDQVHFGYRDSIAQPIVEGAPPLKRPAPDGQPVVPAGAFLLGHPNQNGGAVYRVQPEPLSTNSSFAAFRILEQDVAGFEAFLSAGADTLGIDRELLAAKVCGRWRNGTPLVLSPHEDGATLPNEAINDFDYVSADPSVDDTFGYRCPIGAHTRRTNPRGSAVVGGGGHLHRIIRRAMPYGRALDPGRPDDEARGLVGFFINADLANQFEFLMSTWMNGATFVKSVPGPGGANPVRNISGDDVLGGLCGPSTSSFTIPVPPSATTPAANLRVDGFSRFVVTRGGAYCYLPSITALRHLARLPG